MESEVVGTIETSDIRRASYRATKGRRVLSLLVDLPFAFGEAMAVVAALALLPSHLQTLFVVTFYVATLGLFVFYSDVIWLKIFGATPGMLFGGYRIIDRGGRAGLSWTQAIACSWFRFCWMWTLGSIPQGRGLRGSFLPNGLNLAG